MKEINPSVVQHWIALVTYPSFIVRLESFDECAAACCCELGTVYVFFLLLLVVVGCCWLLLLLLLLLLLWTGELPSSTMFTAC
jgi:hypothetical protein